MHSTKVELLPVTQADREAAAQLYLAEEVISSGPRDRIGTNSPFDLARAASMRDGEYDHWDIVQAFARHRIASTPSRGGEDRLRTVSRALHEHLCRRDIMQYLDNDEDCEGLARSVLAALDGTRGDAGEREAIADLHRLQHDGPPAARPIGGGSIIRWAADEIAALRASTGEGLTSGEGKTHNIKCWPDVFEEMRAGRKTAEFRYNDRGYAVGDMLLIREWDTATAAYTHREITLQITHVLDGGFGMPAGYVMLSLAASPSQPNTEGLTSGEGWKLVPVEPTPEMCRAVAGVCYGPSVWSAMLAASPSQPTNASVREGGE